MNFLLCDLVWSQASDFELQWVIRVSVIVVGLVGTAISFTTNSTLILWILGADVSYTLTFPHLVAVLFFKVTNGYGALMGFIIGLTLRILLGEKTIGLPVVLQLPGCTLEDGIYVQKGPTRTVCMLCTLASILFFSWLAMFMFNHGLLPENWDVYKVKHYATASPAEDVTRNLRGEPGSDEKPECDEKEHGVPLQPMSQSGS